MLDTQRSIVDEVEAAIKAGSAEKHLQTARRVTDLFLLSSDKCDNEQIELFGTVLERLVRTIEIRALADVSARMALVEMSTQLASVPKAPAAIVGILAAERIGAAFRRGFGRDRGNQERITSACRLGALVVEGSRYRRAAGAAFSRRQPPPGH